MWTEHGERRAVVHPERVREPAERLKPSLEIMRLDYDGASAVAGASDLEAGCSCPARGQRDF